jgi:hypothetical protein
MAAGTTDVAGFLLKGVAATDAEQEAQAIQHRHHHRLVTLKGAREASEAQDYCVELDAYVLL